MGLREDLGPVPTPLDTAIFIYYLEENETFAPLVASIFEDVAEGGRSGSARGRNRSFPVPGRIPQLLEPVQPDVNLVAHGLPCERKEEQETLPVG